MSELWFAISTGVISGAVSAGLIFVVRTLIVGHLFPWYHDLVYRGINVDGRWFASQFGMAQDFSMTIKQRAGTMSGDARFVRRGEREHHYEDEREFAIEGRIQDRYLTLTLAHKNRQRIGVVSFLLEPVCDGTQLRGIMSFVSMHGSYIDSTPILLARDANVVREAREEIEMDAVQPELPLQSTLSTPSGPSRNQRVDAQGVAENSEVQ